MSLPQPERDDVATWLLTRRAIAAGIVFGCVLLSFIAAYVTSNGWWFLAWWLGYIAAVLVGRVQGWLWGPTGRHAEPPR